MPIFWNSYSSTSTTYTDQGTSTVYWFTDGGWFMQEMEEEKPKKERKLGFFND